MAPCAIDFVSSGTTRCMSSSITFPKPWQVGQAPNGLLNENSVGWGVSKAIPHGRHSKRSLNSWRTGSAPPTSTANALPPPSWYAVSIASVSRGSASEADLDAVDHDLQRVPAGERGRVHVIERDSAAVHMEPAESLATEAVERRRDHIRTTRLPDPVRTTGRRDRPRAAGSRGRGVALGSDSRRLGHRRHEADQQPRPLGETGQPAGHRLRRLARHLHTAAAADRAADPREQQPQVVVDLGRGTDRRSRIPDAVLLADGDGGADAVDAVDVRLLHPLEELPGVGRQRLHVAPLPLRVDRVEGQRRLPRAAHAGDDDQPLLRERQVDVLQVVGPGAPNDDLALGWLAGRLRHACHGGTGASQRAASGARHRYRHGDPLRRGR